MRDRQVNLEELRDLLDDISKDALKYVLSDECPEGTDHSSFAAGVLFCIKKLRKWEAEK
jgi:hypothetical protein